MHKRLRIAESTAHLTCLLFALGGLAATGVTTGYGTGDNRAQAVIDAKVDAVLNFGGTVSAERVAQHDELVCDEETTTNTAYLISYEVIDHGESVEGTYVRIKARISDEADYALKDGNAVVRGEGAGRTVDEATVMAMCDAILESGAKVNVTIRNENAKLAEHSARMDGHGFIVSCERETKNAEENAVTAYCRILSDAKSLSAFPPMDIEGGGMGKNMFAAEMNARRDMLLNSGSEFSVHALYEYGALKSVTADRRCDAIISARNVTQGPGAVQESVEANMQGIRYAAKDQLCPEIRKGVEGHGFGEDFISARRAALCDAFLNRGCHATLKIRYDMGRQMAERAQFRSAFNYFGENITSQRATGKGYAVAMTVSAGGELPKIDTSMSQIVNAVGYATKRWYLPSSIETFFAKWDARQRAVDMVFGCPIDVSVSERNEATTDVSVKFKHSKMGYVRKCNVISQKSSDGAMSVKIEATVEKRLLPVWASVVIMFGLFLIAKKKTGLVGLTIVGILTAYVLFGTGHLGLGTFAIALGLLMLFV